MEDKLIDILQNFLNDENYHELNAVDDILRLFNVVGESEQFYCASYKDNRYERCEEQCHLCKMEY